jgi:plastocyanin
MALTRLPSFTIDSTSSFTFANVTVTSNVAAANANLGNAATANYFIGSGNNLSNIQVANITGIGNLATVNKDGNSSNILYGNGVFATAPVTYGNSNVATFLGSFGSNSISTTGNVTAGNIIGIVAAGSNTITTTGNITGGNIIGIISAGANTISTTGNANVGNLGFGSGVITGTGNITANVGTFTRIANIAVGNVKITGGTTGQLLQTDGTGNLNFVTPTGTTITVDNFTANGVQTDFTLSTTPDSEAYTMVALAGTLQPRSIYTVTGNVLAFSSAPPNTAPVEVTTFSTVMGFGSGGGGSGGAVASVNSQTGTVVLTTDNISEGTSNLYYTDSRAILGTIPAVSKLSVTTPGMYYSIDQYNGNNPNIYVRAGDTISFGLNNAGHPFLIRVSGGGANYDTGLTHIATDGTTTTGSSAQGKVSGTLFWKIPYSIASNTYVYQCSIHSGMVGNIIIEATARGAISSNGSGPITYSTSTGIIDLPPSANISANVITANTVTGNISSPITNLTINTLTANSVVNAGSGTPTLQSATSIVLQAATVVRSSTSAFQFYTCTSTVRDAIAASNGYVIYNTTTNKLQVYANGVWVDLH